MIVPLTRPASEFQTDPVPELEPFSHWRSLHLSSFLAELGGAPFSPSELWRARVRSEGPPNPVNHGPSLLSS